jgi:CRP-like cAMP-binding protein
MKEILKRILTDNYPGISLTDDNLEQLTKISVLFRFSKKEFLSTPTQKNKYIGFVIKGLLKTYFLDKDGKEHIYYFCTDGNITGTLLDNLYVQALEKAELIIIDFDNMTRLLESDLAWQRLYNEHMSSLYIKNMTREEELLSNSAEQRYTNLLSRIPDIEKRANQYDIASHLGITPVALSRIKKNLRNINLLECIK